MRVESLIMIDSWKVEEWGDRLPPATLVGDVGGVTVNEGNEDRAVIDILIQYMHTKKLLVSGQVTYL